jgi:retron-type reverse transcriptase
MMKSMEHRVADPRILRLIHKWLKAGVTEEGEWSEPKTGTAQGSVITPLPKTGLSGPSAAATVAGFLIAW